MLLTMLTYFIYVLLPAIYNLCCVILLAVIFNVIAEAQSQAAVVASIRPLGFIVAAITDRIMPTEIILPDSASPHDYSMRPTDAMRLKKADVLVWIGPEFEAFLSGYVTSIPSNRLITLSTLSTIIPLLQKSNEGLYKNNSREFSNNYSDSLYHNIPHNMHLWLSPAIARCIAEAIHARLVELTPENKQVLDDNLRTFKDSLIKNDTNISIILSAVLTKKYYVFHDAYGYFEKYYSLNPVGYFTINPAIYPSPRVLHKIKTQLTQQQVTCIFSEPQFQPAIIRNIVRGTNVHIGTLDPLGMGIVLNKTSYALFMEKLAIQYVDCLKKIYS